MEFRGDQGAFPDGVWEGGTVKEVPEGCDPFRIGNFAGSIPMVSPAAGSTTG
jgi:hypothetical protein